MVVLAAAICTKNGKALLSRQFSEMTKSRVEGLLAAFPKLIGTGRQHTFIETENIRYVYQPLESLYIVLITNKNSNILEDLDTLHLLAKLVPEYSNFDEYDISRNAFELVFTFDEVIAMGYKERVSLQQIKHFISMESHEEERFRREEEAKKKDAGRIANQKALQIEKQRREEELRGGGRMSGRSGFGGGGMGSGDYNPVPSGYDNNNNNSPSRSSGYPGRDNKGNERDSPSSTPSSSSKPSSSSSGLQGMKLGSKSSLSKNIFFSFCYSVHITIEEAFSALVESDGTIEGVDIKGGLSVQINDESLGKVKVLLKQGRDSKQFQFITHPNIDKAVFTDQSVLKLRNDAKSFPSGGVLKWRCKTSDDSMIPIRVNCWPSPGRDSTMVSLEYECTVDYELKNVFIVIPNPTSNTPVINKFDGHYEYDTKQRLVIWKIPVIDESNKTGALEFSVKGNTQAFFPVKIQFTASQTICDTVIGNVIIEETNQPTTYSNETTLSVDTYEIK
ncbi:hypothetical protein DICPUDRAFT_50669 [Dictyostelium purpureum]|uniref:Coatomer subunit delta n=1 Tax=Dictyostelium purpureum TaxID=5786 RepID=F0ZZK6_DICPU|nr:uncharacterized protein DICPUDRAFT_50669 [Dictyostelium purpureum]EGC30620.1 hypothetical protein DICPUDRAFT_50669 [Dictyostelium purpureum]|eukprot:XP_003292855.1 hypothetical protein DICPUDRAFT_50669 [Dictyostelium purpureum]